MKGPARVEFLPIKHGDVIDLGDSYNDHTIVHQLGFKPGSARSRSGWLVLLVHEGTLAYTNYRHQTYDVKIPKTVGPRKLRPKVA